MNVESANILVISGGVLVDSITVGLLLEPGQILILDDLSRGTLAIEALHAPRVMRSEGPRDPAALLEATRGMDAVIFKATLRITACAAYPLMALRAWWYVVIRVCFSSSVTLSC
jgi:hypothetical protein